MKATVIQPPVGTAPNPARGEVLLPVVEGKAPFPVRFSLRVLHDFTTSTGHSMTDIGQLISDDFLGTVGALVASAVRQYVPGAETPAGYELGDALDLIERLSQPESKAVVDAIMQAVRIDEVPFYQALIARASQPAAPSENGASTSTSPSAS